MSKTKSDVSYQSVPLFTLVRAFIFPSYKNDLCKILIRNKKKQNKKTKNKQTKKTKQKNKTKKKQQKKQQQNNNNNKKTNKQKTTTNEQKKKQKKPQKTKTNVKVHDWPHCMCLIFHFSLEQWKNAFGKRFG